MQAAKQAARLSVAHATVQEARRHRSHKRKVSRTVEEVKDLVKDTREAAKDNTQREDKHWTSTNTYSGKVWQQ